MEKIAANIIERLNKEGFAAFFVGGSVRDLHMGKEPKDFDVATNARLHDLQKVFRGAKVVGAAYGIALVNGIEVAPFRRDVACDGRQAVVEFVDSIEEDLARRDFTMNAMAKDLDGLIVDPFGGRADIDARLIRFVGDPAERIKEDFLRCVRAVRFARRFNFEIERNSFEAIRAASENVAARCAPERIVMELEKMFS